MFGTLKCINAFSTLNLHCSHITRCSQYLPTSTSSVRIESVRWLNLSQRVNPRMAARLRMRDKVPDNYEIIYRAPMEKLVPIALNTTTGTIFGSVVLGAYAYYTNLASPLTGYYGQMANSSTEFIIYLASFATLNIVTRYVCFQYILRIYHNPRSDMYIAVLLSNLPMQTRTINFPKKSVDKPTRRFSFLPWYPSRYLLNGKKILLLEEYFRTPADMENLLKQTPLPDSS